MPTSVYFCCDCGAEFENFDMGDDAVPVCPTCGGVDLIYFENPEEGY